MQLCAPEPVTQAHRRESPGLLRGTTCLAAPCCGVTTVTSSDRASMCRARKPLDQRLGAPSPGEGNPASLTWKTERGGHGKYCLLHLINRSRALDWTKIGHAGMTRRGGAPRHATPGPPRPRNLRVVREHVAQYEPVKDFLFCICFARSPDTAVKRELGGAQYMV